MRADRRGAPTRRPPAIRAEGRGELDVFEFGVDILVWVEALGVLEAGMVVVVEVLGEEGWDVVCLGVGCGVRGGVALVGQVWVMSERWPLKVKKRPDDASLNLLCFGLKLGCYYRSLYTTRLVRSTASF